ncbi:Glycosyltransferase protein, family I [Desulfonema limicola]|uniref:Glycosyltransferase protein, family I n=1 Tax=Desulfonema limicola TaxID=45656 RepID=A0A975B5D6_9BACT|nr:glycosyltransferase [Desulfonema limicola]QTA79118.1 Glycosyltransferase protein, family I [Desulfonema limicola]
MNKTSMKKVKILEIGPYPPPDSGWSVRIKYLKNDMIKNGYECRALNIGKYRKLVSSEYIDVQNGFDYIRKILKFRLRGFHLHMHMNAQAVKGPVLSLIALIISIITFDRASLTFHGGIEQLFFPKKNANNMYFIIYLNFLLSRLIICNNEAVRQEIIHYGQCIKASKIHPIPAFSIQYLEYKEIVLSEEIETFIKTKKHIILSYIALRNGFHIETLIKYLEKIPDDTGIILTGIGEIEDEEISGYYSLLNDMKNQGSILMIENLTHDQFMTLLKKSDIYLRTPVSDGVASSVLEAMTQNVPVVASENGKRPKSVITYKADDAEDMKNKINYVLSNLDEIKKALPKPFIRDTVKDEIKLLMSL